MSTIRQIESRISLQPQFLTKNYVNALFEKLCLVTKNHCNNDYGFILKVNKIISIKDNFISNVDCEIIFVVRYEAETLKPELGKEFDGVVCMIFHGGIFVSIKNKFEVLVPISKLENFVYDSNSKSFTKASGETIREKDSIKVKIIGLKYCTDKKYKCFGEVSE